MHHRSLLHKRGNKQFDRQGPDWMIAAIILGLIVFGVLMVFDASIVEAFHAIGDQWYFIKNQSKYALIGLVCGLFAYFFPLKSLEKLSLPIIMSALFMLIIVLIPGIGTKLQGARRWLIFGPINLQPSEYAKLASIIYLSAWFTKVRPMRSFALLLGATIGLIMLEPDMGTSIVLAGTIILMYFVSGAPLKKFAKLGLIFTMGLVILIILAPYRLNRVKTFLNPMHDPLGMSYHARQVLISLGSGGFWGNGLGRSKQKFQYLPEASTDSIFAVVGEELGFIGGTILVMCYVIVVVRCLNHSRHINNSFISNFTAGIGIWIGVQVLLNIMAMVGLVPLTGVPLPFISYGGSALITLMTGVGFLLNASRYSKISSSI